MPYRVRLRPNPKVTPRPYRVRVPEFVARVQLGLGDILKRTCHALGITPCSGCERRAAALNRWLVFSPALARSRMGCWLCHLWCSLRGGGDPCHAWCDKTYC